MKKILIVETNQTTYGEQRALDPAGALVEAKKIIPHWGDVKPYMDKIKQDYLNNAQINVLRNKILNSITDPDAVNNIINEGNSLNDAMKNLGNSIGQYDPHGSFANHKVDKTKASDRYQYAGKDEKSAYDNATNAVSNIISVKDDGTVDKSKGTYADQASDNMAVNFAPFGIEVMQDSCGFFFVCLLMHLFEFVHDHFLLATLMR